MNELFTIGEFCFRLICPDEITPPENFMKFLGGEKPVYTYTITLSDTFPQPRGAIAACRQDILVTRENGLECRYIGVKGHPESYACYQETDSDAAQIFISPNRMGSLSIDPVFVSLLALERRQLALDAMILHCAFVEYQGEAILFSAPSETGKTTQANLWERCRGAKTINGDRALLQKREGRWYARGWPVCGSSGVCEKKDVPIRAIVMLSQAPEDHAERLAPMKAFTQLYSQITVNRWNREANLHVMQLVEQLIGDVAVYHLACTMKESAVLTLEAILQ